MLHIRLTRIGKKKQPEYRLMVCEKARDPWGKALEILGHYNPRTNPATVNLKEDRIKHWIDSGAQCSETVWNLLVAQGVVKGEKRKSIRLSKKRQEALAKKKKKAEEKKAEAAAAEAAPTEAEAPAEEAQADSTAPENSAADASESAEQTEAEAPASAEESADAPAAEAAEDEKKA
ncbi:30S ribosomal protein S16 [Candidatus Uhrbacteria bacterium]|nr:30S ribosomal protein S16 [Candidatus Uhrbacteria bacterium]